MSRDEKHGWLKDLSVFLLTSAGGGLVSYLVVILLGGLPTSPRESLNAPTFRELDSIQRRLDVHADTLRDIAEAALNCRTACAECARATRRTR